MAYHDTTPASLSVPYIHTASCITTDFTPGGRRLRYKSGTLNVGPELYLIPPWLDKTFRLAKVSTNTITQYTALRRILSVHDLALLEALHATPLWGPHLPHLTAQTTTRDHAAIHGTYRDTTMQQSLVWDIHTLLPEHKTEWHAVILPLSRADTTRTEALAHLGAESIPMTENLIPLEDGGLYHRFELAATGQLFIHLLHGIYTALQDRTYATRFVSDYLKALYGFAPLCDISQTVVFADYLTLL